MSRPTSAHHRATRYLAALRGYGAGIPSPALEARWSIYRMNDMAFFAALGALVIASPAFFFFGRRLGNAAGKRAEIDRLAIAKSTAEETAKRIIADAERDVENTRKSAVISGKEEVMKLREAAEQ